MKDDPAGRSTVSLVRCQSYKEKEVDEAVERAFSLLGGPEAILEPSDSVLLKINALLPSAPEKAVTTHPAVVKSVIKQVMRVTDKVTIGDSPNGPFREAYLKRVYRRCGMEKVAEETGASLGYDTRIVHHPCTEGVKVKTVELCRSMVDADKIINLPKLKTHMLVNITAAVKNMLGAVPGFQKAGYHGRYKYPNEFSEFLLDVYLCSSPTFHLVDAVVGMDENGPHGGRVRDLGFLIAGEDGLIIDSAIATLTGTELEDNLVLKAALSRNILDGNPENITFLGEDPENLKVEDFLLPNKPNIPVRIPDFVMHWFGKRMSLLPLPNSQECTGCARCEEACPQRAITMENDIAQINRSKCIMCYCCYEICEFDAIGLKKAWLGRLTDKILRAS